MAPATPGRSRAWVRSLVYGFAFGVVVGGFLEWYYNRGPAANSLDSGEAHGLLAMLLGAPATWLIMPVVAAVPPVISRALLVPGMGASWGLVWAGITFFLRGVSPIQEIQNADIE